VTSRVGLKQRKTKMIKKYLLSGLALLALASAARANEPKKPSLNAWMENYSVLNPDGVDSHNQRIHVNYDLLRADHFIDSDHYEKERVAARPKINLEDVFSGKLGVFGSVGNQNNHSIGLELDGTLADIISTGFALEKKHSSRVDNSLFQIYAGMDPIKNANIKLGYFLKDGISHFQGVGNISLDDKLFLGVGGQVNEKGKGKLNACVASLPSKKGKELGFKIWGQSDFDGNYSIDATFKIGDNKSLISHKGLMNLFDAGINDPGIADNIGNYRPNPKYMDAKNALFRIRASHSKDGTVKYFGEAFVNSAKMFGKDLEVGVGAKCLRTELPGHVVENMFGVLLALRVGPLYLEFADEFRKGKAHVPAIYAGFSASDVYDCFVKDDE
jgi:hypothetical protein